MKRKIAAIRAGLMVAGLVVVAANATAAIVYVDATDGAAGNTVIAPSAGGGVFTPVQPPGTQGPGGDGLWDVRAFGNGASIYQNAQSGNVDNAQRLATTVSGLASGTYNAFAYYWSDVSNWRIEASLTDDAGPLPLYVFQPLSAGVVQHWTGADGTNLSSALATNPFTTNVMISEGNRRLLQIPLGQVTGTSISVFVDDSTTQADQNERTWYDGVGYELVVPEPTSVALLTIGLGLLLAGCRKGRATT